MDDSFFLAEDSCRLRNIVEKKHLKAVSTNRWLVYRWIGKKARQYPAMDEHDRIGIGEGQISFKHGIGSKLFKFTRHNLFRFWRLLVQSDPQLFLDWHTTTLVANGFITRSKGFGYSCSHNSFQEGNRRLKDEQPKDIMEEEDLSKLFE